MWNKQIVYTDELHEFLQRIPSHMTTPNGTEHPTPIQICPYMVNDECVIVVWYGGTT